MIIRMDSPLSNQTPFRCLMEHSRANLVRSPAPLTRVSWKSHLTLKPPIQTALKKKGEAEGKGDDGRCFLAAEYLPLTSPSSSPLRPLRPLQTPGHPPPPASRRCRPVSVRRRADRVLHQAGPAHQGKSQERRGEDLLWLLQDPREPRSHRRAPPLLEPRRHRPRPRWSRRGPLLMLLRSLKI